MTDYLKRREGYIAEGKILLRDKFAGVPVYRDRSYADPHQSVGKVLAESGHWRVFEYRVDDEIVGICVSPINGNHAAPSTISHIVEAKTERSRLEQMLGVGELYTSSDEEGQDRIIDRIRGFDPIDKFSYFEWRYVRYPWGLPPRDRCEWSPEICRDEARKAAQYQRLVEAIDLDDALREAGLEAEARYREQRRQALTAIIGGLLVMTLVIAVVM